MGGKSRNDCSKFPHGLIFHQPLLKNLTLKQYTYEMFGRQGEYSSQYNQNYSKEEQAQFKEEFSRITLDFAEAKKAGLLPSDPAVQNLVKLHFEFVLRFWTPNKEAYKNLAMNYILPTQYKDSYEEVETGLGKYTYDAVVIWANINL